MPIKDYPFLLTSVNSPARPMLAIRITNPDTGLFIDTYGLIDTGADDCAIPASLAKSLGHNLTAGNIKEVGITSGIVKVYSHSCTIEIFNTTKLANGHFETVYTLPNTPIDFMPNLQCVLLGTKSFLKKFVLTINYPKRLFSLRMP
jgi:hypothetical protein